MHIKLIGQNHIIQKIDQDMYKYFSITLSFSYWTPILYLFIVILVHNFIYLSQYHWNTHYVCVFIHGVMATMIGNGHSNLSSNLAEAVCISHSANTFEKGINSTFLPLTTGK